MEDLAATRGASLDPRSPPSPADPTPDPVVPPLWSLVVGDTRARQSDTNPAWAWSVWWAWRVSAFVGWAVAAMFVGPERANTGIILVPETVVAMIGFWSLVYWLRWLRSSNKESST